MIPELEKWRKENGARYVKESTDIRPRETSNKEDDQKGKQQVTSKPLRMGWDAPPQEAYTLLTGAPGGRMNREPPRNHPRSLRTPQRHTSPRSWPAEAA